MKFWITAYVAAALAMLVLDSVWLTLMGKALYRPVLGDILLDGFRVAPAIVFYLLYIGGVLLFAVSPAVGSDKVSTALLMGAALGCIAYGTYDLTNHATLKAWTLSLTLIDMTWGSVLTAVSAAAGFAAARAVAGAPS
ncbi:MAG: hypothetical protein JWN93_965 [Hyphomicrobiales bacterium]|nr:hypothetical protein [Hyphomicrobiales bacterium]